MQSDFIIRSLNSQLIRKTFPFANAFGVENLSDWESLAKRLNGVPPDPKKSGVAVAEGPHGMVAGLFAYRVDDTAIQGPTLVCDPFWVCNLPRHAAPINALLAEAERISKRCGTRAISIALTANGDPLGAEPAGCEAALFRAGFALDRIAFRKRSRNRSPGEAAGVGGRSV